MTYRLSTYLARIQASLAARGDLADTLCDTFAHTHHMRARAPMTHVAHTRTCSGRARCSQIALALALPSSRITAICTGDAVCHTRMCTHAYTQSHLRQCPLVERARAHLRHVDAERAMHACVTGEREIMTQHAIKSYSTTRCTTHPSTRCTRICQY
jgi:hypothetical protein